MAAAPLEHADQARLALRTIVTEHGPEMLSRPATLSNLLADLLPDAPRIARILVAAAQDHIADELREHTSAGMDTVTALRLTATVFADATMFPQDACAWVVGEFALALGLVSDNSAPPIRFSPSVTAVMAGDGGQPVAAGPDKSTQPASTEPPAGPAPAKRAKPDMAAGRHRAQAGQATPPDRARQRAGGADQHARIKAPFPAAAGLAAGGAAGVGAAGVGALGPPAPAVPDRTKTIWIAVVTADRGYFDDVIANGHVDAASIEFPSHFPERRFELKGPQMQIGRRSVSRKLEPEIDLAGPPTDPGISHEHAVLLAQEDGSWSVLDRGSSNGTQVNGREIESGEPVPLHDGDRVCLGAWTALTFHSNLTT
ncbi:MAG TPA: FHA domain-containing protein [Streptosporangiaceae bacterium]|nr:FHA domain-containing protein [Streptosporangiaceae bacterium]